MGMEFNRGTKAFYLDSTMLRKHIENPNQQGFDLQFGQPQTVNGFNFGNPIVSHPEFCAQGMQRRILGYAIPVNNRSRNGWSQYL